MRGRVRFWCPRDYEISSLNFKWLRQAVGRVTDVLAAITQIDFYISCLVRARSLSLFIFLFYWLGFNLVSCRRVARLDTSVLCVFFSLSFILHSLVFITWSAFGSNSIAGDWSCLVRVLYVTFSLPTLLRGLLERRWRSTHQIPDTYWINKNQS